jgi:hypothetical protein
MRAISKPGSLLGLIAVLSLSACAARNAPSRVTAGPAKF